MTDMENIVPSTFPALFAQIAATRSDRDAVVTVAETLSYAELDARSARMARALLAAGAGKGTRIALMAPDGVFWITAFIASQRIGALLTVVSTLCTPPELAHILRTSDTQIFLSARRFLRHDYPKTLVAALPGLADAKHAKLRLIEAPYLRSIWLDDADGLEWAGSIDALLDHAEDAEAPDTAMLGAIEAEIAPGEDAVIVYTSGSTSLPKAVVHTQRTLASHPRALASYFLLKSDDRMMPLLPAFWLGGMAMATQVLTAGATLVYPPSPETEAVLDTIEQCRVNRVNSWGDMLFKLRDAAVARGIDVDAIVGLGRFRDGDGKLIPSERQVNMLGMSETFAAHSAEPLDTSLPEGKPGSSGRTVNGYERRIVSPVTGEEVPVGEPGELHLRGGGLMSGFYKRERGDVFTRDGFYPTGDLVRVDTDGYLYFIARLGDMIKTKAANVSRLEVEAAMRQLPEVELPVVAGLDDPEFGQMVVAAVVPRPGTRPSERSIQAALRDILSSYKIPRRIVFIEDADVPRTATGKLKLADAAAMVALRIKQAAAPALAEASLEKNDAE